MKMLEVTRIARAGDEGQKWLINPAHILEIGQWEEHSTIYFPNGTSTKVKETVDQLNALLRAL
jgi:uncharacterized protein YlzI (FlbEa/FlbD family)